MYPPEQSGDRARAMLRLCKNCKHFYNDFAVPFTVKHGRCALTRRDIPAEVNPVDGALKTVRADYDYASIERSAYGKCGPEGALFEPEENSGQRIVNAYGAPMVAASKGAAALAAFVLLMAYGTRVK